MKLPGTASIARAALAASLCAAGCGAPPAPAGASSHEPFSTENAPLATVTSRSGALRIDLWAKPAAPVAGENDFQLAVFDAAGAPALGLAVTVVPWMPAHGHGAPVRPTVVGAGPGVFLATPVYLYMPGRWELRIGFEGSLDDAATAVIDVP
jgi:YtkA-like